MIILDDNSAVYKIFRVPFYCRTEYHNLVDVETAATFGVRGNHTEGGGGAHQLVDLFLTIDDMVELYKCGAGLMVTKYDEIEKIVDIIYDHFDMWLRVGREATWQYRPPIEDLQVMNEMARELFPWAASKKIKELETVYEESYWDQGMAAGSSGVSVGSSGVPTFTSPIDEIIAIALKFNKEDESSGY